MPHKEKSYIFILIIILLIAVAYSYNIGGIKIAINKLILNNTQDIDSYIRVSAKELIQAPEKYNGKKVMVSGGVDFPVNYGVLTDRDGYMIHLQTIKSCFESSRTYDYNYFGANYQKSYTAKGIFNSPKTLICTYPIE